MMKGMGTVASKTFICVISVLFAILFILM